MEEENRLIGFDARILVTGARGFIGKRVVKNLLERGFTNVRCLVRPSGDPIRIHRLPGTQADDARLEIFEGNLLSRDDCIGTCKDVQVIYHLAAGRGEKSYASAYLNSVVSTRNLLDACLRQRNLRRFVNVSSFAAYTNRDKPRGRLLDEACPVDQRPALRGDPYSFAKVKQEEVVIEYARQHSLPYVIVRPGVVYGPGNEKIHGRVGIGSFGIFLHLGGSNKVPLTYVDNCADAIVLAGITSGINEEVFNVVDDDLPSSRRFLSLYKKHVRRFPSVYVPRFLSYLLCYLWEKYAAWSQGQLPNTYNRREWHATWKRTIFTNEKLKQRVGWRQTIPTIEGLRLYFEACRAKGIRA